MKKIGILAVHKTDEILGPVHKLSFFYTQRVEQTGRALAVIIPTNTKNIEAYIDMFDGFILPGGNDIHPEIYGETVSGSVDTLKQNDEFLLHFLEHVIKKQKPVLGICKGLQIINVFFGGTLHQDIENHMYPKKVNHEIHPISVQENSFLSEIFGQSRIEVNSIHHQCIKTVGSDLKISALSQDDNIIEGIEHTFLPIYGVQWHPEFLASHQKIFDWFLQKIS